MLQEFEDKALQGTDTSLDVVEDVENGLQRALDDVHPAMTALCTDAKAFEGNFNSRLVETKEKVERFLTEELKDDKPTGV